MAKYGEGDPRWIVSDREDGQNVNAWHWAEKDVSDWAKKRLGELLEAKHIVDTSTCKCKTTEMSDFEGECTIYNRKGKISFLMDVKLNLSWEGELIDAEGGTKTSKGKFECPEIEHDTQPAQLQVNVTCSDKNPKLLELMQTEGRRFVRAQTELFLNELKDGHGVASKKTSGPASPSSAPEKQKQDNSIAQFKTSLVWRVPPTELWQCLTDQGRASAYTRCPAVIQSVVGGNFSFLNGNISGSYTEVVPNKTLAMKWRVQDWSPDFFSLATITLDSDEEGTTIMQLLHTNIPAGDLERTQQGWRQNFWEPIKMLFGYGFSVK
eukprot:NODE_2682_length_1120_cov_141.960725_g2560_i0.p1 GENE.NODE_2682_length_1120_cov_141.960725_g2560_i0~~NODE_2682_length_1120_cov_141.960725_g2560_i0.p1  ORF type:complete len:322 (-),score=79.74 NODE_2682_length_1120_cov_141.960725_g2560_i0:94-1059(-)